MTPARQGVLAAALALAALGCERTAPAHGSPSFACPMHQDVVGASGSSCSRCGMRLEPGRAGVHLCPEHADSGERGTISGDPGVCPLCKRTLVPGTVALAWDCAEHDGLFIDAAGSCPICARPLLQETVAVAWRCPEHPRPLAAAGDACAACGKPRERVLLPSPHGDHNPKHGGTFFMAGDRWHHIEGTLPEKGLFRVHLYDELTRPMPARGVEGRIEVAPAAAGPGAEPRVIPLALSISGDSLEARADEIEPPVDVKLHLDFPGEPVAPGPASPGEFFDFRFERPTVPGGSGEVAAPGERAAPRLEVPADPRDIAREIAARARRVEELVFERRALAEVYLPALEAKDLALALAERLGGGADSGQGALERGLRKLVRGAWLLDIHADRGDLEGTRKAFSLFSEGVREVTQEAERVEGPGSR